MFLYIQIHVCIFPYAHIYITHIYIQNYTKIYKILYIYILYYLHPYIYIYIYPLAKCMAHFKCEITVGSVIIIIKDNRAGVERGEECSLARAAGCTHGAPVKASGLDDSYNLVLELAVGWP